VRMNGSLADYDGDGDASEGIDSELKGLQENLYKALQEYAKNVAGTGLLYDPATYPYFWPMRMETDRLTRQRGGFVSYPTWTARLLKAAYNYHTSIKDPGAFAHNSKYTIQLLYDSIADLNSKTGHDRHGCHAPPGSGHFAGNTEPFRHWDEEGMVEAPACAAHCCRPADVPGKQSHNRIRAKQRFHLHDLPRRGRLAKPLRHQFCDLPSGAVVSLGGKDADGNFVANDSNLCLECHQGRSSASTLDNTLKISRKILRIQRSAT